MKTFLFVVPTIFRAGSVLRNDILKGLQEGNRILVVSPFSTDETFRKEFPGVVHTPADTLPLKLLRRIARLRDIFLAIDKPYFVRARIIERSIVSHRRLTSLSGEEKFWRVVGLLARPFRFILLPLFDRIEEALLPTQGYHDLIKKYRPDGIILGTASEPEDITWLALSRTYQIPAFVVDMPWSYFETRFFAVPRRAHYMIWNERIRDEFLSLYSLPRELLHITGSQRYDFYVKKFPTMSREVFFKTIGADSTKKLIVYFTLSDYAHPHQAEVTGVILKAIKNGVLPKDTQVLVRLGWKQKIHDGYKAIMGDPNLIIQKADDTPHQDFPAHLIYYSDVVLSVGSSLTLDAAVLDKPKVYTGFSTEAPHPDDAGIAATYEYEFYKHALKTNGVKVAYNAHDFLSLIKEYMNDPSRDREERKKLVEAFLGVVDGNAGKRIAETVQEVVTQRRFSTSSQK